MGNVVKLLLFWIFQLCFPFDKANNTVIYNMVILISFVFMIFGVLIFLEILVLRFFELQNNTKEEIITRERKEVEMFENAELLEE